MAAAEPGHTPFVGFLTRAKPLRQLPAVARYAITLLFVLVTFAVRYALGNEYPYYLVFLPAIILASFIFDRGSGFVATFAGGGLAFYLLGAPTDRIDDVDSILSIALFLGVGLLTAAIIEALRGSVEETVSVNERMAQQHQELRRGLNLLETVIEGTPDAIYVKDRELRFQRANSRFARSLGAPTSALLGNPVGQFLPADQAEALEAAERGTMESRRRTSVECQIAPGGEEPRWFECSIAPWYDPDGTLAGVIGVSRDVHLRKFAEDAVRTANAQKALLLHDINHRVKNHLQSVLSMLSLSRRKTEEPEAQLALDAAISRLSVLARVYDRLALKPEGDAAVNARDFIEGLCSDLHRSLVAPRPIALRVDVDDAELDIERAVSIGLVINEALSNALKHGFPDERSSGSVAVALRRSGDRFRLEIADDGRGMVDGVAGDGIGTKLIGALAQQLGGSARWDEPPGTTVRIEFPSRGPGTTAARANPPAAMQGG